MAVRELGINYVETHVFGQPGLEANWKSVRKYHRTHDIGCDEFVWTALDMSYIGTCDYFRNWMGKSEILPMQYVMAKLGLNSGVGFPWDTLGHVSKRSLAYNSSFRDYCQHQWTLLRTGDACFVWRSTDKWEIRPFLKVENNDYRTFTAGPADLCVLGNMLCLDANNKFYDGGRSGKCWSFVGNSYVHGEWHNLHTRVRKHPNPVVIDCVKYDSSIIAHLLMEMGFMRLEWLELSPDDDDYDRMIHFYQHIIKTAILMPDGTLFFKQQGNPSGSVNTVVDNTIILFRILYFAWIILAPPSMSSLAEFLANVEAALTGDDNMMSVSDKAYQFYNYATISAVCARHLDIGMKDELKGRGWEDVHFLSAGFTLKHGIMMPTRDRNKVYCQLTNGGEAPTLMQEWARLCAIRNQCYGCDYFDELETLANHFWVKHREVLMDIDRMCHNMLVPVNELRELFDMSHEANGDRHNYDAPDHDALHLLEFYSDIFPSPDNSLPQPQSISFEPADVISFEPFYKELHYTMGKKKNKSGMTKGGHGKGKVKFMKKRTPNPKKHKRASRPSNTNVSRGISSQLITSNPSVGFKCCDGRLHPKYGVSSRFTGCDLVGNVVVPTLNAAGTILFNQLIAPGAFARTRLAALAPLWERYKYNSARLIFQSTCGSTVAGTLCSMVDYDPTDDLGAVTLGTVPFVVAAAMGSAEAQAWQNQSCLLKYVDNMMDWETDSDATDPASLRLQNQGQYWLAIQTPIADQTGLLLAQGQPLGSIYIEYDIEFFIPQLQEEAPVEAMSFNLLKNGVYSNLGYESQAAWYGLLAAYIDNIGGVTVDSRRNNDLKPYVTAAYQAGNAFIDISVSGWNGNLRWSMYAATNDGLNIGLVAPSAAQVSAARLLFQAANAITTVGGYGDLDSGAGGTICGPPWTAPNQYHDYPQAIQNTNDQGVTGPQAGGTQFVPTNDFDCNDVNAPANPDQQMQASFVTRSENGVTTVRFGRDSASEGTPYFETCYFSIDTISANGASVAAADVPTLVARKKRIDAGCGVKHGKHVSVAPRPTNVVVSGDVEQMFQDMLDRKFKSVVEQKSAVRPPSREEKKIDQTVNDYLRGTDLIESEVQRRVEKELNSRWDRDSDFGSHDVDVTGDNVRLKSRFPPVSSDDALAFQAWRAGQDDKKMESRKTSNK